APWARPSVGQRGSVISVRASRADERPRGPWTDVRGPTGGITYLPPSPPPAGHRSGDGCVPRGAFLLRVRAGYKTQTTMAIGRRSERDGGGARADAHELGDERAHAQLIGCSLDAVQITRRCELIDLHVDTFIPYRMWGYDPLIRHRGGPFGRHLFGHLDVPRMLDGGLDGAMWSITTNPLRTARARWRALQRNLARLRDVIARSAGRMVEVGSVEEDRAARAGGAHGCFLAIQGLNAVQAAPGGVRSPPDGIVRATLVHLTNAVYGATSSPLGIGRRHKGLTTAGREAVADLNARRVFVDLAHIHERAFFDVVAVHDRAQPLLVSHTGVAGVRPHWRNLTDAQIKAIARTGGTIGIIFHGAFLRRPGEPAHAGMVAA